MPETEIPMLTHFLRVETNIVGSITRGKKLIFSFKLKNIRFVRKAAIPANCNDRDVIDSPRLVTRLAYLGRSALDVNVLLGDSIINF